MNHNRLFFDNVETNRWIRQEVIYKLFDKYDLSGLFQIVQNSVLEVKPINELGSPVHLVSAFEGKEAFEKTIKKLENEIYKSVRCI